MVSEVIPNLSEETVEKIPCVICLTHDRVVDRDQGSQEQIALGRRQKTAGIGPPGCT